LRPERIALVGPVAPPVNAFVGVVEFVSYLGAQVDIHVRLNAQERAVVQVPNRPDRPLPSLGENVTIGWGRETGTIFPAA
jgi:putative spermidine/putrescine transport system ATP-binding protein